MPAKSPGGLSSGLVWRRSGLALQRLCFPCGCAAFLARQQARYRRPPLTLRPKGCDRDNDKAPDYRVTANGRVRRLLEQDRP